ncbi:hypothetical protein LX36DRAFT_120057 [Colletotrichum falcatum]|nr:hypothetical protein LX36DRAFT_120057 [Colletotrichum falcatum]
MKGSGGLCSSAPMSWPARPPFLRNPSGPLQKKRNRQVIIPLPRDPPRSNQETPVPAGVPPCGFFDLPPPPTRTYRDLLGFPAPLALVLVERETLHRPADPVLSTKRHRGTPSLLPPHYVNSRKLRGPNPRHDAEIQNNNPTHSHQHLP